MKKANYVSPEMELVDIDLKGHLLGDFSLSDEETPSGDLNSREGRKAFDDEE